MPVPEATLIIAVRLTAAVLAVMAASVEAGEAPQVGVQVVLPVEALLADMVEDIPVEELTADLADFLVEVLLEDPAVTMS